MKFEWDDNKNRENIEKHALSFYTAQRAFFDENRLILSDKAHSEAEDRFFCFGDTGDGIATVRFVVRDGKIRIFGAG
jgi:uncharacterized DUF497 family protein